MKTKIRKLKILMAASEAVPYIKSGGLGDVCGALPKALKQAGHDARIVIPRHWGIDLSKYHHNKPVRAMCVHTGGGPIWCGVYEVTFDGVTAYMIDHNGFFGRSGLYDDGKKEYDDNPQRFSFFCRAVLQLCKDEGFQPDVIHCNDWQTALIPAYLKTWDSGDLFYGRTATVFTIHNIGYQGVFHAACVPFLGLWKSDMQPDKFEDHGAVNLMKGAIHYCDAVSTVSPSYAQEILGPVGSSGLHEFLGRRKQDLFGILNGVDYDHWDPATDRFLPAKYSPSNMSGKAVCKSDLQREFCLHQDPNVPLIGIVTRFTEQKGLHQLMQVIKKICWQMRVQFAIVGAGEKYLEDFFGGLPREFGGQVGAWIGYDNGKAHRVEAGCDFFLMPSMYEPCGLNQIYSLKYATLPIVRATGGLRDTVWSYDERTGHGNGFSFDTPTPQAIFDAVGWAVSTYYDRRHHFDQMRQQAMKAHFSWADSARHYDVMYHRAILRKVGSYEHLVEFIEEKSVVGHHVSSPKRKPTKKSFKAKPAIEKCDTRKISKTKSAGNKQRGR